MKKNVIFIGLCMMMLSCQTNIDNSQAITLEGLLHEMVSYNTIAQYPAISYKAAQVSSYDRRSVSPDSLNWFANGDGFGYERLDTINGRVEKVLFDKEGPGVVTRFWMTTNDKRGTIRIYLDGQQEPEVEVPAFDMSRFPVSVGQALALRHTHYKENMEETGGTTFFLPIPYASQCKITFEEPDMKVLKPRYYHIGYRIYPADTQVQTFTLEDLRQHQDLLNQVNEKLLHPVTSKAGEHHALEVENKGSMLLEGNNQAINSIILSLDAMPEDSYANVMNEVNIQLLFDGKVSADCSLANFFSGGTDGPVTECWYFNSDGKGNMESRWVMPYQHTAEIRLVNPKHLPFKAKLEAYTNDYKRDANTLYFHAQTKQEDNIPTYSDVSSPDMIDWNFATLNGRGVYCGDLLALDNHCPDWYGEGDEKIWVDDDASFPSFFGTGTEDYYNCSWAPVVVFQTPFGGAPRADEESSHGMNAFFRTRNLDVIPFSQRLKFDIEMMSWHDGSVDYRATVFWYGDL